jgi:hypothetical protein
MRRIFAASRIYECTPLGHDPETKSVKRFSEKIMLKQEAKAG